MPVLANTLALETEGSRAVIRIGEVGPGVGLGPIRLPSGPRYPWHSA